MAQATATRTRLANAPVGPTLSTTNVNRSREFYENKLGLKVDKSDAEEGAFEVEAGKGTRILVYKRDEPPKAENTALSFMVEDVKAVVKELKDNGVRFEEYDMPGIRTENGVAERDDGMLAAWFKDPDGNILCVANH